MYLIKHIKAYILLLVICSCSHTRLDIPTNEIVKSVEYNGREYSIPISQNYCRYDETKKGDKAIINLIDDSANSLIAVYEDCATKDLVISGELRDSPRSITIRTAKLKNTQYVVREQLGKIVYDSISDKLDRGAVKELFKNISEDLTEKKLMGYGFSKKRSAMIREDYKGFSDKSNLKKIKRYDKYAAYELSFVSNHNYSSYVVEATTKVYNKPIKVVISRTLEDINYNRNVVNQIIKETQNYLKEFVDLNDKNDFREYRVGKKKVKIYTPKNFLLAPKEAKKLVGRKYEKLERFGFDVKEILLDSFKKDKDLTIMLVTFLKAPVAEEMLESKEKFLDLLYQNSKETAKKYASLVSSQIVKKENGLLSVHAKDRQVILHYTTLINKIPIVLMADFGSKKKEISQKRIDRISNELVSYVKFLDANQ